ncbi:hypothetical protein HQQ94_03620 [Shewanella sp. VB17]|uniref:hypothetical protein n=1 Tax=Shewanella sp. VB17 TaxID=2739432 RepID=UPI001563A670|nr:hypothetical protein [Shewanella sp. VB17]NRD72344.1 hypothetical protein [Shewanella sp. VB17]
MTFISKSVSFFLKASAIVLFSLLISVTYANELSLNHIGKCASPIGRENQQENLNLVDLTQGDPFYYTSNIIDKRSDSRPSATDSKIPHLPAYFGYFSTNNTYRFVNIVEQVFTMIGEGKHGLWRVQDNGMVREYLIDGALGLPKNADIFSSRYQNVIQNNYTHDLSGAYVLPQNKVVNGRLNYIDLPIYHDKYRGKYQFHEPIDLPSWYCTMSAQHFPYAAKAMEFAFAQPSANKVGPLGKRAGLDIHENYSNVLRLNLFEDARTWVNVTKDSRELDWHAVDASKTMSEYYIIEKRFQGANYLFLMAIYDNKNNDDFSYIRPDGPYYEYIKSHIKSELKTKVTTYPHFNLASNVHGLTDIAAVGTKLYGVHHPDRDAFNGGGACPMRGGDYANYPEATSGSGWPTNYEEVTPLCDSVLLDIKLTTNLDNATWNDPAKYLANAGIGTLTVDYHVTEGRYGEFQDDYHLENGITNQEAGVIGPVETIHYQSVQTPVEYIQVSPHKMK